MSRPIARRSGAPQISHRLRTGAWLAATTVAAALPAAAQQAAPSRPAAAASDAAPTTLDTVVITANKRRQTQREVAGTVTVLDGAALERLNARDQEDTLKLAPGVQFNKGDVSSNTITIRGIGTSTTNEGGGGQQGPTGQYLEDVPLSSSQGKGIVWDPVAWDLDRVEVLRGPQGVLFGSGSLGGAVRYLFAKPRLDAFEASVKADYAHASGGDGKASLFGMVNAPLASDGSAGLRVVAYDRRDPGYVDNLGTGKADANDVRQTGGRVLLTLKPTRDLSATLVASTQDTKQGDTFSVSPDRGTLAHTAPNDSRRKVRSDFYSLTADWNVGPATLTSITGYWNNTASALIDDTELFASVGFPLAQVYRPQSSKDHAVSQELRVAGNAFGALSYVAGAFYQRYRSSSGARQIDPSGALGLTDLVDLTTAAGGTEKALFADTEYALGGGWSAGVGARYYKTGTDFQQRGTTFGAPSDIPAGGVGSLDSSDHGVTPKATVKYRFAGDNLWYALASKGYRYGGVNSTAPFSPYKSDSLWNYETGVRLTPVPDLQVDLTAFYLDWKDAQFTFFTLANQLPTSGIGNVGAARSIGLETSLRYRFDASFDVGVSAAYIDAKTTVDTQIPSGRGSLTAPSGSRLPGTPRLAAALQGTYRFEGPLQTQGRVWATDTYTGERVMFLGDNKPADSFNTVDLGIAFSRSEWTVSAGLSNATDERGVMSITGAPAGVGAFAQYFLQRPRTLTVSLRYDY